MRTDRQEYTLPLLQEEIREAHSFYPAFDDRLNYGATGELNLHDEPSIISKKIRRIILHGDPDIWQKATELIEGKVPHVSATYKDVTPANRILMTQLYSLYTLRSIARFFEIEPSSCRKMVNEGTSAICFVLGQGNRFLNYKSLNAAGRNYYRIFSGINEDQSKIMGVLEDERMAQIISSTPSLKSMLRGFVQHNNITDFLCELGFTDIPSNMDRLFFRFATEGFEGSGIEVWLRRVLYKKWANSGRESNVHGSNVIHTLLFLQREVPKYNLSRYKHFLDYLSSRGEGSDIKLMGGFKGFVNDYLVHRERDFIVRDISNRSKLRYDTARKIYNCGIKLTDYVLTAQKDPQSSQVVDLLNANKIQDGYKNYIELIRSYNGIVENTP